jgi:sphingomyelin phosphodiesterase acid-like 3
MAAMVAFTNKTVAFFAQQVRLAVGNIPVMFALGNADSYTGLGPDSTFLSSTAELYYTQLLNGTVDHQAFVDTFKGGGYYSVEPAGTNLMVIGLNTFEFSPPNPYMSDASVAVAAQLAWLDSTLASARAKGKKVWLLMHVPPGADKYSTAQAADGNGHITSATTTMMWNQGYQANFLQILSKYPGLVTQTFGAHTHMDEYRIMSPGNVLDITPGIAPYFGDNPAFKVFTFSRDTLMATDYTSLNYDLATMPPRFNDYYTFSTAYYVPGFLNDSLARLFPLLLTDRAKQELYRGSYFSGHNYTVPVGNTFNPITDRTWPIYWCGIGKMGEQELIDCVNSY